MRILAVLFALLSLACHSPAQLPPDDLVVATRLTGPRATQLLDVNPTTGAITSLGRFASDNLPPLAVAVDLVNRDVLLALDLGGTSRFVRLHFSGLSVVGERMLADIPGTCTQVAVALHGDLFASFDGAGGGLVRIPRNGGTTGVVLQAPYLTAMTDFGFLSSVLVLAQSGDAGPPVVDPVIGFYDLLGNQWSLGPFTLTGFTPRGITGVIDMPTAVPRQVISHPDGTFSLNEMFIGGNPRPVPVTPPLPPGGAVAMKAAPAAFNPIVLGGAAHPFLETFTVFIAMPPSPLTRIAGPFPGDPVDFAVAPAINPHVLPFGQACGTTPPMQIGFAAGGLPRIGNSSFALGLTQGVPQTAALLVLGLSDQQAGAVPLPAVMPSNCLLHVSPDAVSYHMTDGSGRAQQLLPVPNRPSLIGFLLFGQWLQAPGLPFATSPPAAIQVGL